MIDQVSVFSALLAGVLSFVSPCVLPLVPVYLTYLGGAAASELDTLSPGEQRRRLLGHAVLYILGFTAVFMILGAALGGLGEALRQHLAIVRPVAGVVTVALGFSLLGIFHTPLDYFEKRIHLRPSSNVTAVRSLLLGVVFALGWTPCVGPVLGAILGLALNHADVRGGTILLACYSLGLAIPFLALAAGASGLAARLKQVNRHGRAISIVSGVFVMIMGVLIYFDAFAGLARFSPVIGT